jgi:hypothetical protein
MARVSCPSAPPTRRKAGVGDPRGAPHPYPPPRRAGRGRLIDGWAVLALRPDRAAATLSRRSDTIRILGWIAIPLAIVKLTPAGVGASFPLTALWIVATAILIPPRPDLDARPATATALAT